MSPRNPRSTLRPPRSLSRGWTAPHRLDRSSRRRVTRLASIRKSPEKTVRLPRGSGRVIRDLLEQRHDHAVEHGRGFQIHRLLRVVAGLMVHIAHPVAANRFFGRPELVAELERERRHALADEAVLIASNESILFRFAIGLHVDALRLRGGADRLAQ